MSDSSERSRTSNVLVAAGIVLIVALCVLISEATMTPPPLARGGSPAPNFAGAWKGFATAWVNDQEIQLPIELRIENDGAVAGSIGSARINGRFTRNRSWLGRKLNLRTDYIIVGEASDYPGAPKPGLKETMTMPMNLEDSYLKGSVFVGRRGPARIMLFRVSGPASDGSGRFAVT